MDRINRISRIDRIDRGGGILRRDCRVV